MRTRTLTGNGIGNGSEAKTSRKSMPPNGVAPMETRPTAVLFNPRLHFESDSNESCRDKDHELGLLLLASRRGRLIIAV